MTRWSVDDLVRRIDRVLETAERVATVLLPGGYPDAGDTGCAASGEKILAETAMLAVAVAPVAASYPELGLRLERLVDALACHARSDAVRTGICFEPWFALDHGFAHLCLSRLGRPNATVDELIRAALAAPSAAGRERLPHRQLEQDFMRRLASAVVARPYGRSAAASSMLGRPLDALTASREDVYSLTHAVMYDTDLGERRPPLPRPRPAILDDAAAALAGCLDDQDYDLAGEVLLCWPLLGGRWSAAATFGFHVLTWVEDQAGFLPAPITSPERFGQLQGLERTRYALASAYHTVYVMGLLCSAALRPGGAPPAAVPSSPASTGAGDAVLRLIPETEPDPHWRQVLKTMPTGTRDTLAPLFLTVCLRRAAKERNFGLIDAALRLAVEHDLLDGPAPLEAAHLLRRVIRLADQGKAESERAATVSV